MLLRSIGWVLIAAACALLLVAGGLIATGELIRVGDACWQVGSCGRYNGGGLGVAHLLVPGAIILFGIGYGVLAASGSVPFVRKASRRGLAILAIGLLALETAYNMPIDPLSNQAESLPLVLGYGIGLLAIPVGFAVTVWTLLGPSLLTALILPIGLLPVFAPWLPPLALAAVVAYRTRRKTDDAGLAP